MTHRRTDAVQQRAIEQARGQRWAAGQCHLKQSAAWTARLLRRSRTGLARLQRAPAGALLPTAWAEEVVRAAANQPVPPSSEPRQPHPWELAENRYPVAPTPLPLARQPFDADTARDGLRTAVAARETARARVKEAGDMLQSARALLAEADTEVASPGPGQPW